MKYKVYAKHEGKWVHVATCLTEDDARAITDRRAELEQPSKVMNGRHLIYERG